MKQALTQLLREPLAHFVLLGGILFAAFSLVSDGRAEGDARIRVTAAKVSQLQTLFERTWQRAPTQAELNGLVDDWVLEEVLYREAVAQGLQQDDIVVRRRLRQKMEILAQNSLPFSEPSDSQLEDYLQTHAERFQLEPSYSFKQIFLDPKAKSSQTPEQLLAQLRQQPEQQLPGSSLFKPHYQNQTRTDVENRFGRGFVQQLNQLPVGQWSGPVASVFGDHLVLLQARVEGELPPLAKVRNRVIVAWQNEQQDKALKTFYQQLLGHYQIDIEWPGEVPTP